MTPPTDTDIHGSLGVILLGGMGATALSGAVAALVFLYFRMYSADTLKTKALVFWLWIIDAAHTCLINTSNWESLMVHFGDRDMGDFIPTSTALTILFTCLSSYTVHCFYAYAIWKISRKWYISAPLMFMATLRLALGINSTLRTIELGSWEHFMTRFVWSITTAYCLSAAIDIYLSMTLCYFLRVHRKRIGMNSTNKLLDRIMINTVNNGTATCAAAAMSVISWFIFRGTLIFLGTHFLIGKLYTISVVSTLLLRRTLREEYNRDTIVSSSKPLHGLSSPQTLEFMRHLILLSRFATTSYFFRIHSGSQASLTLYILLTSRGVSLCHGIAQAVQGFSPSTSYLPVLAGTDRSVEVLSAFRIVLGGDCTIYVVSTFCSVPLYDEVWVLRKADCIVVVYGIIAAKLCTITYVTGNCIALAQERGGRKSKRESCTL